MALVDYSDSDSNTSSVDNEAELTASISSRKWEQCVHEAASTPAEASKRNNKPTLGISALNSSSPSSTLPSLPSTFHSLYSSNVRTSTQDDPALHSGRSRQTPHIEGNWPTHIYLEWYPSATELSTLRTLLKPRNPFTPASSTSPQPPTLHSLLESPLGAQLPLHISLSAPLTLQTAQKPLFLDSFERAIATGNNTASKTTTGDKALNVRTGALEWVPNFDRTRWFLVLKVTSVYGNGNGDGVGAGAGDGHKDRFDDGLIRLLTICNAVVRGYGLPLLYEEKGRGHQTGVSDGSCFHISIAWTLEDPAKSQAGDLARIRADPMKIMFERLKLKMGSFVHEFPLG